jgi:hypothetical protein
MSDIAGYRFCRTCQAPILDVVAATTGGRCAPCWRASNAPLFEQLEVLVEGRMTKVALDPKRSLRNRRVYERRMADPARKQRKHAVERVKRNALRRLRALHAADYAVILAEERGKAGLDPWPLTMVLPGVDTDTVLKTLRAQDP